MLASERRGAAAEEEDGGDAALDRKQVRVRQELAAATVTAEDVVLAGAQHTAQFARFGDLSYVSCGSEKRGTLIT